VAHVTDVVVIGGIFREVLPVDARTVRRIGGSGFVAALTAASLGADVALVSFVGERDQRAALGPLLRAGVDVSAVKVLAGASGIFSFVDTVDRRAPRPGYRPAETLPSPSAAGRTIPSAPVVLAFGFPDYDPSPWMRAALRHGGTLLWDRQGWLSRNIDRLALSELPAQRRVYVANVEEMRADTNRNSYAEALAEQPAAGFDAALIKCGRWGALAIDTDRAELIPAYLADTVSVIGSGDCFGGAVSARLAAGDSLADAARIGSAAASLFVERSSNIPSRAWPDAVEQVRKVRSRWAVNPAGLERVMMYLAGPWFTVAEALLIDELEATLDNLGVAVISPRRDIGELPSAPTRQQVFEIGRRDYEAIERCDLVVAVLDGNDPGTLMEVGYAAKVGKPMIGLSSGSGGRAQPMREAAGVRVATTVSELIDEVTGWVREHYGIA
jgi:sugar/nucleoside kinase (ribokinase family)/nucleoside 2-deoxyribosyltransferase